MMRWWHFDHDLSLSSAQTRQIVSQSRILASCCTRHQAHHHHINQKCLFVFSTWLCLNPKPILQSKIFCRYTICLLSYSGSWLILKCFRVKMAPRYLPPKWKEVLTCEYRKILLYFLFDILLQLWVLGAATSFLKCYLWSSAIKFLTFFIYNRIFKDNTTYASALNSNLGLFFFKIKNILKQLL